MKTMEHLILPHFLCNLFTHVIKKKFSRAISYFITISQIHFSDTFDENTPPIDEPEYISSLGAAVFKGMQSGDSNAIWLMQVQYNFL